MLFPKTLIIKRFLKAVVPVKVAKVAGGCYGAGVMRRGDDVLMMSGTVS